MSTVYQQKRGIKGSLWFFVKINVQRVNVWNEEIKTAINISIVILQL